MSWRRSAQVRDQLSFKSVKSKLPRHSILVHPHFGTHSVELEQEQYACTYRFNRRAANFFCINSLQEL